MRLHVFFVMFITLTLLEDSDSEGEQSTQLIKRDVRNLMNQDYQDLYKEMLKSHHGSTEENADDESRLKRIVGEDNYEVLKGGTTNRRRNSQIRSVLGKRRARSQALRREKLNSQSLRSHQEHMRQSRDDVTGGVNQP